MRKSREEAAQTRKRIVTAASEEFRKNGIVATGLNDLMSAAGLTHGGFYKHFESKDQLVAEACAEAVETAILERLAAAASEGAGAAAAYLSTGHRDNPATGCPLSAIGSELARSDEKTRAAATAGFLKLVEIMAGQFGKIRAGYRQAACPGRGIDDDRRADHVADRDRPGVVGGDTQGGREELGRWLTSSARGNSSGLCRAVGPIDGTSTAGCRTDRTQPTFSTCFL